MGPAAFRRAGPPSILDDLSWWAGARSELVPPYFDSIAIHVPELEVHGTATVTGLEPCPALADGEGEVVTGRYVTRKVVATTRITLEGGSVVGGTAIHPIWSVDRSDWVPLGELTVGEQLLGRDGPVRIAASAVVHQPTRVYNLEVNGEHVYQIGDLELLAHNADVCVWQKFENSRFKALFKWVTDRSGGNKPGVDLKLGKIWVDQKAWSPRAWADRALTAWGKIRNTKMLEKLEDQVNRYIGDNPTGKLFLEFAWKIPNAVKSKLDELKALHPGKLEYLESVWRNGGVEKLMEDLLG